MYSQRYRRDDVETTRGRHERRRSRSRSRSRRRQRARDSRSRSRSRSVERYRQRRSRSRGHTNRSERTHSSRHYRRSRSYSRSRSPTESHAHMRSRRSRSRTPKRGRHADSSERMRSTERDNRSQPKNAQAAAANKQVPTKAMTPNTAVNDVNLQSLPLPKAEPIGAYYNLDTEQPIDKERIHREIEEKLRLTLAKEGKVYPPPKPVASHPVFANDGSFLEIFKRMQEQQQIPAPAAAPAAPICVAAATPTPVYTPVTVVPNPTPTPLPVVGRRRGGKILKTGLVAKQKTQADGNADPKDFWALYLAEVNKYKNHACESETGTRPLVK